MEKAYIIYNIMKKSGMYMKRKDCCSDVVPFAKILLIADWLIVGLFLRTTQRNHGRQTGCAHR